MKSRYLLRLTILTGIMLAGLAPLAAALADATASATPAPAVKRLTSDEIKALRDKQQAERDAAIAAELGLTPEQQAKISALSADVKQKLKALADDKKLTRQEKDAKRLEIIKQASAARKALLTPEQIAKSKEAAAKRTAAVATNQGQSPGVDAKPSAESPAVKHLTGEEFRALRAKQQAAREAAFAAELGLSPEQQAKLSALSVAVNQKLKALLEDKSLPPQEKDAKRQEIVRQAGAGRAAILTPEQVTKSKDLVAQRKAAFAKELGLTPEQEAKLSALTERTNLKMRAVMEDHTLPPAQQAAKRSEIFKQLMTEREAILTPAQIAKYNAIAERQRKENEAPVPDKQPAK